MVALLQMNHIQKILLLVWSIKVLRMNLYHNPMETSVHNKVVQMKYSDYV